MAMIDHPTMLSAPQKLPVLATVTDSMRDITANWRAAGRLSATWGSLLAVVGLTAFAALIGAPSTLERSPWLTLAVIYVPTIVFALFMLSVAVGWHRLVLLGEQPARIYFKLDRRVWRYIGAIVLMSALIWVIAFAIFFPVAFALGLAFGTDLAQLSGWHVVAASAGGAALFLTVLMISARVYVALPARAIGERMKFREALRITRGNSWRMLVGTLLVTVPSVIVNAIMNLLLDFQVRMQGGDLNWPGIIGFIVLMALALAALVLTTLISISYLSRAYRFFAMKLQDAM